MHTLAFVNASMSWWYKSQNIDFTLTWCVVFPYPIEGYWWCVRTNLRQINLKQHINKQYIVFAAKILLLTQPTTNFNLQVVIF